MAITMNDERCRPMRLWIDVYQDNDEYRSGRESRVAKWYEKFHEAISKPTDEHLEFSGIMHQNSTGYALTYPLKPCNTHITVRFNLNPA